MLKNGIFCEMVILVVFKGFLVVKNLEILIQIAPDSPIYYYYIEEKSVHKQRIDLLSIKYTQTSPHISVISYICC